MNDFFLVGAAEPLGGFTQPSPAVANVLQDRRITDMQSANPN